jgi:hypothetical protein
VQKLFSDYTEAEFITFMEEIFSANENSPDEVLDQLLEEFERITEYPSGSDLIYYSESEALCTPWGITGTVKQWREANGLPGFKPADPTCTPQ